MTTLPQIDGQDAELVIINHSGGKDSQAMTIFVQSLGVPAERIVLVHARLPGADWDGIEEHIRNSHPGLRLETCVAVWADGREKTFLGLVEQRGMWPSSSCRNCTSDLKRTPLEVLIRRLAKEYGATRILSCDGRRAQESDDRAALATFGLNKRLSKAGRRVFDWLPIHALSELQVFTTIASAQQQPHWAYGKGMSRLSCCFCVLAKACDLRTAAALKPELAKQYIAMEQKIGQSFRNPNSAKQPWLSEVVGDLLLAQAA